MQSQAFHRARAAMYLQRAARHEARAAAFGAQRDTPCRMQLVAGRLGVDSETRIRLPDELAAESAASLYVVELRGGATGTPNDEQARLIAASLYVVGLRGGATGTPNDEQARLIAALLGRMSYASRIVDKSMTWTSRGSTSRH
jgi:hypothetical protein